MGQVRVTVQTEKRLNAINNLSIAIRKVAEALSSGTEITIKDNVFHNSGEEPPVNIDSTTEKGIETRIEKFD